MIVCKFGGTSVADRAAHERLASIVRDRLSRAPLVVVSALAGVSDGLIRVVDLAVSGRDAESAGDLRGLADRHRRLLEETPATPGAAAASLAALEESLEGIESLRRGIALVGDASPWVRARVIGAGEFLASRLVATALEAAGIMTACFDAREVLRTAGTDPEKDTPVPAEIARLARERLQPLLRAGRVVVTQGFVGSDPSGRPTLLGRGGSDYSASLLGAALDAERIEIWTDVDGVLTANPKVVREARRVCQLSFAEASELAYFGAKVLHPSTVLPAVEASIPVWVGNARRPAGGGTTILAEGTQPAGERGFVKAIAEKRGLTVVSVISTRMLMAHGFLARIFQAFDRHRVSVDIVTTSEVSVSLTVDDASRLPALIEDLRAFAEVEAESGMAVVCLVGDRMRGRTGLAADVFQVLRGVRVRMITQGASAINLSLVLAEEDVDRALRALHEEFFRGSLPPEIFGEPFRAAD